MVKTTESGTSIPGRGTTLNTKTRTTAKSTSKAKPSKSTASSSGKARASSSKAVKTSSRSAVKAKTPGKKTSVKKSSRAVDRGSSKVTKQSSSGVKSVVSKKASVSKASATPKKSAAQKKSVSPKKATTASSNDKQSSNKLVAKKQQKITATKTSTPARQSVSGKRPLAEVKTKSGTTLKAVSGGAVVESKEAKKISVTEKLSTSHLVKRQAKPKATKAKRSLKLVKKGPIKVPATKISRSDSYSSDSKVIMGNFSFGEDEVRPVVAPKRPVAQQPVDGDSASVLFESGDKIVYPGHGVGEIEGIRSTVLDGQEHHIYNITILESGMKVMVPVSQASSVGLRKIIDKQAIDEVFSILRDRDFKIDTQTWNRRFREYSQKIKTGSVFEIAIVLRDLSVLSVDKELSFGENKMLDMAESLLVSEIALARSRSHEKVAGELRALFTT